MNVRKIIGRSFCELQKNYKRFRDKSKLPLPLNGNKHFSKPVRVSSFSSGSEGIVSFWR